MIRGRNSFLLVMICFALTLANCAKKSTPTQTSIKISSKGIAGFSAFPDGRRLCFGFDISADDIKVVPKSQCQPKRSLFGGFVADGKELVVQVPSGNKRQIDLFAYLLPEGDITSVCPKWDESLDYANVYKVGGTVNPVDLLKKEVVVNIETQFPGEENSVKNLFLESCVEGEVPFSNISITSDNPTNGKAKVGDTVTINFQTDQPIAEVTALIFGNPVSIASLGGNLYQIVYTLTGTETEGNVSFVLSHSSGSVSVASDGSTIQYDKTSPIAPTSIVRSSPANPIDMSTTPTFMISGVETGATVELHSDATCSSLVGSAIAVGSGVSISSSAISQGVVTAFSARQIDEAGNSSTCSVSADTYVSVANQPFVSVWQTTTNSESVTLPLRGGFSYNFIVDWGDGNSGVVTSDSDVDATHVYATAGTYTVIWGGTAQTLYFNANIHAPKIISVPNLGSMGWTSFFHAFHGCGNLTTVNGGDTSAVTDFSYMFQDADGAIPDTSGWDTSSATNMTAMFWGASLADPVVSGWDTSNVTNMASMFRDAISANPDVAGWDVSNVTNFNSMFSSASSAAPDVSSWNTASATSMALMFYQTQGNPDVSGFNMSGVTNISGMFAYANNADPDVSGWDVSSVADMDTVFIGMAIADPDVSGWDTSSATTMYGMFASTTLANPDVSSWDVSNVSNFAGMFNLATSANPDVSLWVTSSATDFSGMFWDASSANPFVSAWDTTNVMDMSRMFQNATMADPDLSAWNFNSVINMSDMFNGGSISQANYSALLVALDTQIPSAALTLHGGTATCDGPGATAKANLESNFWVITDGCP